MPQVTEIRTNLPRSTKTYDEEMQARQSYANPPEYKPDEEVIDLEEAIGSRYEQNYMAAASQRWGVEQQRFMGRDNERRRFVNLMHPHGIFRRLRRAGVDARIEAPHFYIWQIDDETGKLRQFKKERSIGRVWLHDEAVKDRNTGSCRIGISAWVWDEKLKQRVRRCVTSLEYPYGPEWSLMKFDEFDVPIAERWRGWRTAMLHLIVAGVLTEEEVDRAFGPVPLDSVSLEYRRHLQFNRKRRYGLVQ
jgi:hypothetical protein